MTEEAQSISEPSSVTVNEKLEESINISGKNIDPGKKPETFDPESEKAESTYVVECRKIISECRGETIRALIPTYIDNQLKYIFGKIIDEHFSGIFFEEYSNAKSLRIVDLADKLNDAFVEFRKNVIYKYESYRLTENEHEVIRNVLALVTSFGEKINELEIRKNAGELNTEFETKSAPKTNFPNPPFGQKEAA